MKLGITGLSRVGKTTVFETLTKNFSTGDSRLENRIGTVKVPDQRVDFLSDMYNPKKTIFAQVEYYLPAKQTSKKSQAAWSQIRDCDALIHVLRNFKGYENESPKPLDDFQYLDQEMVLADLMVVEKRLETLDTEKKRGKTINPEEYGLLEKCKALLENETPLRKDEELAGSPVLKGFTFLTAKPMMVLFNNDEDDESTPDLMGVISDADCLVIRGQLEHELAQLSQEEAVIFQEEYNIHESAMDRVIVKSYEILGLISFFTVGEDEVKAWTIRQGTEAVDAADVIHSDIKKGFIRAEVLAYDDLLEAKNYQNARKLGTVRLEGKTYPVKDGDIINFRFNV